MAPDGFCSIVEAIDNANIHGTAHTDCAPGDAIATTIALPPASAITFTAAPAATDDGNALPLVTSRIVVRGNGSTWRRDTAAATPAFRFIFVAPGAELAIDGVRFENGLANVDGTGLGGGAIYSAGVTTIESCQFVGNVSRSNGGALYLLNATASVVNTTISGNGALGMGELSGLGGSIMHAALSTGPGLLDLRHVTMEDNGALAGGGLAAFNFDGSAQATIANTIVAAATPGNTCANAGLITSNGGNVEEADVCNFGAPSDRRSVAALLSPRDAATGLFHAPRPGSPARCSCR